MTSPDSTTPPESQQSGSHQPASTPPEPTDGEEISPKLSETLAQVAARSSLGALASGGSNTGTALLGAIGGVRGIIEAVVPGLLFVIVFTLTQSLPWAAGLAVGIAVVATLARLIGKSSVTAAIGGLVGVVASAVLALTTGRAEDNFVLGFYVNSGYALGLLISIAVRWPLIGVLAGYLMGDGVAWRHDRFKRRVFTWLTLAWVGMFVARLAVQLPFYFSGNVAALGLTRIAMGLPLYAPVLVLTWLIVRSVYRRGETADKRS